MNTLDFHIKTKECVTRALIFYENDMIGEMQLSESLDDGKIYIGTVPEKYKSERLILYLLSNPATFDYCFDELFNIPLTDLVKKENKNVENFVIVNTPEDVQQVILTIPDILTEIFKIPKTIILVDAMKSPFRLKLESMSKDEKDSAGFGMDKHFIRYIPMITDKLTIDMLAFLNNLKTHVTCYKAVHSFSFYIKLEKLN